MSDGPESPKPPPSGVDQDTPRLVYRIEPPALRVRIPPVTPDAREFTAAGTGSPPSMPAPASGPGGGSPAELPLVLCLHGWGMDGDWFARLLGGLFDLPAIFLFPTAPQAVVRPDGGSGWSWYDYDGDSARFVQELERLERHVLGFLRDIERTHGLRPCARILLGFSQGGYGGSFVALRHPEVFRGLAISGARIKHEALEVALPAAAANGFRVLACHGRRDPHVSGERARASLDALAAAGIATRWEEFDAGHSLGRAQVRVLRAWIEELLGVAGAGGPDAVSSARRG